MRPLYIVALSLVALTSGQVIESRSSVKNPDGSTTHNADSRYSHSTYSSESTGPDGTVSGRTVFRDTDGKVFGNEWKTGKDGKIEQRKIEGAEAGEGIGGRSTLGGLGGFGSPGLGTFGPSIGGAGFGPGNTGFGHGVGSGVGSNIGSGFGGGYGGFPSGGFGSFPWSNFGSFGQFGFGEKMPHYTFGQFGFKQPPEIPNYSKFLLGGVGFNPNLPTGGYFGNIQPGLGIGSPGFGSGLSSGIGGANQGFGNPGFGGVGGFGNPGYGQRSYKHEVDPASGKQTYSFSESSGHSTESRSNTGH